MPFPWPPRHIYRDMIERPYFVQTLELLTEVELVHLRTHEYERRHPPRPKVTSLSRSFSNEDEQSDSE